MQLKNLTKEAIEKAKVFIKGRKFAYHQVFNKENQYTKVVLEDLSKFCRANTSTFHQDDRMHAVLEGRREVFLRIQQHLNLSDDELWDLYGRGR
jgi:hypothetical protein